MYSYNNYSHNSIDDSDLLLNKNEEDENEDKDKDKGDMSPSMRLLKERQILISESISSKSADKVMKQLLLMNSSDKEKPITMIINSPGGEVYSGFGIFDMIQVIEAPVRTVICGLAASMGSIISLAANKDDRYATPNSKIMIHQPLLSGLMGGPISDIEIEAKEMMGIKKRIVDLYVQETGKEESEIRELIERNQWMTAEEAKEFGHISKVITSFKDIKD